VNVCCAFILGSVKFNNRDPFRSIDVMLVCRTCCQFITDAPKCAFCCFAPISCLFMYYAVFDVEVAHLFQDAVFWMCNLQFISVELQIGGLSKNALSHICNSEVDGSLTS